MENTPLQDEFDPREIVKLLVRHWKRIVVGAIIGGVLFGLLALLLPASYTATSVVSINESGIPYIKMKPINLFASDIIETEVVAKVGSPIPEDLDVKFLSDIKNKDSSIVIIEVTASDPQIAIFYANAWAEAGIGWIHKTVDIYQQEMEEAKAYSELVELDLVTYLEENGLAGLSWAELVLLTGAGKQDLISLGNLPVTLPAVSSEQRTLLARYLREKELAEWYSNLRGMQYFSNVFTVQNESVIINYAESREDIEQAAKTRMFLFPSVGLFGGLLFSILWLLVAYWWQSPAPLKKEAP